MRSIKERRQASPFWSWLSAFALAALPVTATAAYEASTTSVVLDAYVRSMAYPEKFTAFVRQNPTRFDDRFERCLGTIIRRVRPGAMAHSKRCEQIAGYGEEFLECIKSNDLATVWLWATQVRQVVREGVPWEETQLGGSYWTAKQVGSMLDPRFPELLLRIAEGSAQAAAPALSCEQ